MGSEVTKERAPRRILRRLTVALAIMVVVFGAGIAVGVIRSPFWHRVQGDIESGATLADQSAHAYPL